MALIHKVIFYILKCTVLNLNDISTKDFSEAMKFINCKKCDNLTIGIAVNSSIFPVKSKICSYVLWLKTFLDTAHFLDSSRSGSTNLDKLD